MPQMNKGGKFIFGKSVIQSDGTVQLPPQAVEEYRRRPENSSNTRAAPTAGRPSPKKGKFT